MLPSLAHVQFPIFAMMTGIQPRQILIPASMLPVALHASLMFIHCRDTRDRYLKRHWYLVSGADNMTGALIAASNRLAIRYELAGVVAVALLHAQIPIKLAFSAVLGFVLADVLLKLVSGLSTKKYGLGL